MSICGTEVADVHPLEHILLIVEQGFQRIVEAQDALAVLLVEATPRGEPTCNTETYFVVGRTGVQVVQIFSHTSHSAVDAHIVVVQNHEQIVGRVRSVVDALECQAAAHGSVADDGYYVLVSLTLLHRGYRHAQRSRDRVAGMSTGEGIVFTFFGRREGANAFKLTISGKSVTASGQNLVTIGLVADVPHQQVTRRVVDIVQCYGQLHCAEARSKVSWIFSQDFDQILAQFVAHRRQCVDGQLLQIGWRVDLR